jgi:CBS domain containing-hemolysin-like protein
MTEAGSVLKPGEVIHYDDLVFEVERVEKRRIMRVRLELLKTASEENETRVVKSASK